MMLRPPPIIVDTAPSGGLVRGSNASVYNRTHHVENPIEREDSFARAEYYALAASIKL